MTLADEKPSRHTRVLHNFTAFKFENEYFFLMEFSVLITNLTLFFHYDVIFMIHRALFRVFAISENKYRRRMKFTSNGAECMSSYMRSRGN